MRSKDVKIGMLVRVTETHLYPDLLGRIGTVTQRYGNARYAAFEVRFGDERRPELLWHHQFEETAG